MVLYNKKQSTLITSIFSLAIYCSINNSLSILFVSLLYFNDIIFFFCPQSVCSWRSLLQQILLPSRNPHLSGGECRSEHCHESTNKISPEVWRNPDRTLPQTFPAPQDIQMSKQRPAKPGSSRRIFVRWPSSHWLVFQVKKTKTGKHISHEW